MGTYCCRLDGRASLGWLERAGGVREDRGAVVVGLDTRIALLMLSGARLRLLLLGALSIDV